MASLYRVIAVVIWMSSLGISSGLAETSAQESTTRAFTDPRYGYSLQIPAAWKPSDRTLKTEALQRLMLDTPNKNTLIVSVYRLPRAVTRSSDFELIGNKYVDSVVSAYLKSFDITMPLGGEKKENKSDVQSMRFWQGTSALHASFAPAMVLSLHAIKYGSDVMVNVVYISGHDSRQEVRAVDALMDSLSFTVSP
jgi:hypothetical protein